VRRLAVTSFVLSVFLAACGGGGTATTAPGGQTTAPGQPTTGAEPTQGQPAPQPGAGTVAVVLNGGADAGSYTGSENPNCTYNFFSPDTWGVQYSLTEVTAEQFSSLQVVHRPTGGGDDGDMFAGVGTLVTVGFGSILDAENYRTYEVEIRTDDEESDIGGTGTMQVNDGGSTAVLHFTGTTADGVGIDATVNCPSVTRG
jgi:hypothetical protein